MSHGIRFGLLLLAFTVGCGGKISGLLEVDGGPGGGGGDQGGGGGSGSGGGGGVSPGSDGSTIVISVDGGVVGIDDATVGVGRDASIGPEDTGVIIVGVPDASVPPRDGGTTTITCGTTTCDGTSQTCCMSVNGMATCGAQGSCSGFSLACSSPENCPSGDVCCASLTNGTAACQSTCDGTTGSYELCTTDSDCSNGETCRMTPFGVSICRGGGGGGMGGGGGGGGMGGGGGFGGGGGGMGGGGTGGMGGTGTGG